MLVFLDTEPCKYIKKGEQNLVIHVCFVIFSVSLRTYFHETDDS